MTETNPTCLVCEKSDEEVPLLVLRYQGSQIHICPFHLPILIHKPEQLADKLPGIDNLTNNT